MLGIGLLVILYMFVPIFIVILMSFNDPASRIGYSFDGFTLRQLAEPLRALRDVRLGAAVDPDRAS